MATLNTFQENIIANAKFKLEELLAKNKGIGDRNAYRLSILEICSSIIGGYSYKQYCAVAGVPYLANFPMTGIEDLLNAIRSINISPSIVLSILAVEDLFEHDQKQSGAYHTDFRLASVLAKEFAVLYKKGKHPLFADLSCGTGMLLVSLVLELSALFPMEKLLSQAVYGFDLSANAIRGALLSLSSLTGNVKTVGLLRSHLIQIDSLSKDESFFKQIAPKGFDCIIGNPPWEKLKLSLHEYLRANGHDRHYGEKIKTGENDVLHAEKKKLKDYAESIRHLIPDLNGEVDLYMPFLSLSLNVLKKEGVLVQLLPASLIRNQGAESLRKMLMNNTSELSFTIISNKGKYFNIDSRFKFLIVSATKQKAGDHISICHASAEMEKIIKSPEIVISSADIKGMRSDFSLPEVRTQSEWNLFKEISLRHPRFDQKGSLWEHVYHREADMTLDKPFFKLKKAKGLLPLVEGRMIHQYRSGAKAYVSGTGRKAIWEEVVSASNDPGKFVPQYYMSPVNLSEKGRQRVATFRAAFCDITGQTNERTMLATMIPSGCICGNKVPTLEFLQEEAFPSLPYIWLGLVNGFVYDWLLRRIITTNANFFIVDSIPIPIPPTSSDLFNQLGALAEALVSSEIPLNWESARIRAKIDGLSAMAYGISYADYLLILADFNSMDRTQPAIRMELQSYVTRDLALAEYLRLTNPKSPQLPVLEERLQEYKSEGATPYVPSQFVHLSKPIQIIAAAYGTRKPKKGLLPTGADRRHTKVLSGIQ